MEVREMHDMLSRIAENMVSRVTGPMKFRLVLQPLMATFFAFRDGLKDARAGTPPYFWFMLTDKGHRVEIIRNGWKSVGKIFILALVLDAIYQIIAIHFVYPGEAVIVAFILAIIPYLVLRGIVTRVATLIAARRRPREKPVA
jgi:hypothetical protein